MQTHRSTDMKWKGRIVEYYCGRSEKLSDCKIEFLLYLFDIHIIVCKNQ